MVLYWDVAYKEFDRGLCTFNYGEVNSQYVGLGCHAGQHRLTDTSILSFQEIVPETSQIDKDINSLTHSVPLPS